MLKRLLSFSIFVFTIAGMLICNTNLVKAENNYGLEIDSNIIETTYNIKIQKSDVVALKSNDINAEVVRVINKNEVLTILEIIENKWLKVKLENDIAYIDNSSSKGIIYENTKKKSDTETELRKKIVETALQYEGGRYVWGGINPNFGVDCSGFTRYIMLQVLGKELPHSSVAQANCGKAINVSLNNLKAGDLIFYANGRINHVALYIGEGKVISASSEKTGIRVLNYDYRQPIKAVSMFAE